MGRIDGEAASKTPESVHPVAAGDRSDQYLSERLAIFKNGTLSVRSVKTF
jgi:hypothetical protein